MLKLTYPERVNEIKRFVRKHHYTRRCPGVWTRAYAIANAQNRIQAVLMYGPAPYPTVARAFCRRTEDQPQHIWQHRMVAAGISAKELDALIDFAHLDLLNRGYWWVHTLTDPVEKVINGGLLRLETKGYTGDVYHRTGALYLGTSGTTRIEAYLIDGHPVHVRQGAITLTLTNVHTVYPEAKSIRVIRGNVKHRWAYILAHNERERADRVLLMKYHQQEWEPLRQPRLFSQLGVIYART